jgi:hypothetical protein
VFCTVVILRLRRPRSGRRTIVVGHDWKF